MARPAVDGDHVVPVAHRVHHGSIRIELFPLLIVVGNSYICTEPHVTRIWRQLSEQQLEQRGLADAIGTDHANAVATCNASGKISNNSLFPKGLGHAASLYNELARQIRALDIEPYCVG